MSLSKERQYYHLTPSGWIEGTFKGDFGYTVEKPIPKDRVLTIACIDEMTSSFSKPYYHDEIEWRSGNESLLRALQSKYGERPKWFGYSME